MTKTSKKLLLIFLLTVLSVFMFNAQVFAVSNTEEAITWFKDSNNFKDKTVFVGQRIAGVSSDYSITRYLQPTIKSDNTSVVDLENSYSTSLSTSTIFKSFILSENNKLTPMDIANVMTADSNMFPQVNVGT